MLIGLVLLGLIVILLFFGIAGRVFKSFGMGYFASIIAVGALIGCSFIPVFRIGNVAVNVAGSVAPAVFAVIFFVLASRTREVGHAAVAAVTVLALYTAVVLLAGEYAELTPVAVASGVAVGGLAYLVGRTKLAAVCAVFAGVPAGALLSSLVRAFASGAAFSVGSPAVFDTVILAAVAAVCISEAASAVKRMRRAPSAALTEAAEEFDPDEYKRYFDE